MNFTEVVAEVVSITKRPDKISDIRREVNAAISFCSNETEFARDLVEGSIALDATLYTQNLVIDTNFPRFRKVSYLKPPAVKFYLDPVGPTKIFENCKEASNSYYVAGGDIIIKTSALYASLLYGYYAYPATLTDANPTNWILTASPYMIIDRAAGKVFANIGDDASAKRHMDFFGTAWLSARRDLASGVMPQATLN